MLQVIAGATGQRSAVLRTTSSATTIAPARSRQISAPVRTSFMVPRAVSYWFGAGGGAADGRLASDGLPEVSVTTQTHWYAVLMPSPWSSYRPCG